MCITELYISQHFFCYREFCKCYIIIIIYCIFTRHFCQAFIKGIANRTYADTTAAVWCLRYLENFTCYCTLVILIHAVSTTMLYQNSMLQPSSGHYVYVFLTVTDLSVRPTLFISTCYADFFSIITMFRNLLFYFFAFSC